MKLCKLRSDAIHTCVQTEQKRIVYSVTLLYKINMLQVSRKKLRVGPFEFRNIYTYNNHVT
jgi:hypothetical protein